MTKQTKQPEGIVEVKMQVSSWTPKTKYPCSKCGTKIGMVHNEYNCKDCNIKIKPFIKF